MAFTDEYFKLGYKLQKEAGLNSEIAGTIVNPLNWYGGTPIGGLAGLLMTDAAKRKKDIEEDDLWKNLLIPGYAPYRLATRNRASLTDD